MKLHEDKFAFLNIINLIHEDSSIRADILEKDYYVTVEGVGRETGNITSLF